MIAYQIPAVGATPQDVPHRTVLEISEDGFTLRLGYRNGVDPDEYRDFFTDTMTWLDARRTPEFGDFAVLGRVQQIGAKGLASLRRGPGVMSNLHALTKSSRLPIDDYLTAGRYRLANAFIVPFASSPWGDWVFVATVPEGGVLEVPGVEVRQAASLAEVIAEMTPTMIFDAAILEPGKWALSVTLSPVPEDTTCEVYFETTAGVLTVARSAVAAGVSSTVLDLRDVPEGTKLKVKAGFKYFPGINEHHLTA